MFMKPVSDRDYLLGKLAGFPNMKTVTPKNWKDLCLANLEQSASPKVKIIKATPKPYYEFNDRIVDSVSVSFTPDIDSHTANGHANDVFIDDIGDIVTAKLPINLSIGHDGNFTLDYNEDASSSTIIWGDPNLDNTNACVSYDPNGEELAITYEYGEFAPTSEPVTILLGKPSDNTFLLETEASPITIAEDYDNGILTCISVDMSGGDPEEFANYNFNLLATMGSDEVAVAVFGLDISSSQTKQYFTVTGEQEQGQDALWFLEIGQDVTQEPFVINFTPTAQDFSGTCDKSNIDIYNAVVAGKEIIIQSSSVIQGATVKARPNLINITDNMSIAVVSVYVIYFDGNNAYLIDFFFGATSDYSYTANTYALNAPVI